jgi:Domain of Unknown Function (DUF748)
MSTRSRRWLLILGGSFVALLIIGFAAFQFAIHALKGQVEKALGPYGEVQSINVGLTGVEIIGIRIRAPQEKQLGWPATDQLRAERILVVPAFCDLLSAKVVLRNIRIEGAYISMLRTKAGRMSVLPSLLETPAAAGEPNPANNKEALPVPPISIGKVELVNGTIEFYDATIRQPPLKLRLEQITASLGKIQLPELKGRSPLDFDGVLKGVQHDGKVSISGLVELATKESEIFTRLQGVDLVALQPYLIKATESGVQKGTLDLDIKSSINKGILHAPGTLTLTDLELASSSTTGSIMGMPRNAVVGMMKDRSGKISVKFVLDGNINDPHFSLNENLATRIGSSIAGSLGVSFEGLTKGVGGLGSDTVKGLGRSIGKLFKK